MPNTCITLPKSYIELFENDQKKEILYVSEFREEKKIVMYLSIEKITKEGRNNVINTLKTKILIHPSAQWILKPIHRWNLRQTINIGSMVEQSCENFNQYTAPSTSILKIQFLW